MKRSCLLRVLGGALLFAATGACGTAASQDRPEVVSTFPAIDEVLPGLPAYLRIVYDERVHVLNDEAVRITAYPLAEDAVGIPAHLYPDPRDDHALLAVPAGGGHFVPGAFHDVAILEGAAANDENHYRLDRYDFHFTAGARPSLFVATDAGLVYELDPASGAQVAATAPPAGFLATNVTGADARVFVWLKPAAPGDSVLASFVPGAATITTTVTLSGETGTREGAELALSIDGRTIYATARDAGTDRVLVHRVDVATGLEVPPALVLSPVVPAGVLSFRPAVDITRNRMYVPISDGAGGGRLAFVDLAAWGELDAGPAPGVDALPTPDGAGPAAFEPLKDFIYVDLADETSAGFLVIGPEDFAQFPARETVIAGVPRVAYPLPDGSRFLDGLDGYSGLAGMVQSDSDEINEGFAVEVRDDVGGTLGGSTRVGAIITDPSDYRFFVFSDNGTESFVSVYDFDEGDFFQVDLDLVTPGIQALSLATSSPGAVLSATTLLGSTGP